MTRLIPIWLTVCGLTVGVFAQPSTTTTAAAGRPDWRRIGNSAVDLGLAGLTTGAVSRIWYSADGATLFAKTADGRVFTTEDFEGWNGGPATPVIEPLAARASRLPEAAAVVRSATRGRMYAAGQFVYRSEDAGLNWSNLTGYRGQSILGEGILDLAVSPREPDEVTVAGRTGVWRTVDGGLTWSSLNSGLPNLTFDRILATPNGVRGVRIAAGVSAFEWAPGERTAWRPLEDPELAADLSRNARLTGLLGARVTASAVSGAVTYAGTDDGRLMVSTDGGQTWNPFRVAEAGRIERIAVDPADARVAVAVAGARPSDLSAQSRAAHVLRTMNGGLFWDDLTSNLPDAGVRGVAFERSSGAVYVASERGVFWTMADFNNLARAPDWQLAGVGLPADAAVVDVRLDAGGNQLYAGVAGLGIYSTTAPHRKRAPRLASAADYSVRAAAPGSVLTVYGSTVRTAVAGGVDVPVLASGESRSEIQIPFNARGPALSLVVNAGDTTLRFGLPIESVAPAIFIDRDGTPMILSGETGALLDASSPARAGGTIQVLSSGLGQVSPEWPAGVKAPADNPPSVAGRVHAFLDGQEAGVTRAVLAPGYVGLYLVELQLPSIVNAGAAELMISIEGKESNRVRIYVEP